MSQDGNSFVYLESKAVACTNALAKLGQFPKVILLLYKQFKCLTLHALQKSWYLYVIILADFSWHGLIKPCHLQLQIWIVQAF